jgi:hypothetical protein
MVITIFNYTDIFPDLAAAILLSRTLSSDNGGSGLDPGPGGGTPSIKRRGGGEGYRGGVPWEVMKRRWRNPDGTATWPGPDALRRYPWRIRWSGGGLCPR